MPDHDFSLRGITILVVESDPDCNELLRLFFDTHDATVVIAKNVGEGHQKPTWT
jgi:DNA-binding response OmpR family regulator